MSPSTPSARLLLAEDNVMIGMVMKADLERAGHEVLGPYPRLNPALEATEGQAIGLALVDIDLQRGDSGIELAQRLREERNVASVFVTGQIEQAREADGAALGALGKPFSRVALLNAVERALRYAADGKRPDDEPGLLWF